LNRVNEGIKHLISVINPIGRPKVVNSLLGNNITKIACGGVHNICLSQDDHYLSYDIYKQLRSGQNCDYEISIENNFNSSKLKCHKYILVSRSTYFYKKIVEEKVFFNN
jgi:hypothetical protein